MLTMRGCSDASDVWMLPMRGCFRCLPWECFLCLDASDAYLENTSDAWMLPMLTSRMLWCCCRYQRPSPSMTTAMSWLRAFFKMAPIFATRVSLRPSPNPRGGGNIFFLNSPPRPWILLYLYNVNSASCHHSDCTVWRSRAKIRTRDGCRGRDSDL